MDETNENDISTLINGDFSIDEIYHKLNNVNKQMKTERKILKRKSVPPLLDISTLTEYDRTDKRKSIDVLVKYVNSDEDYVNYKLLQKKINYVNKNNFILQQSNFTLSSTQRSLSERAKKEKKSNYKFRKETFIELRKFYNIKRNDEIEYEQEFSSSDSYDSDLIPFDEEEEEGLLTSKISEIKKGNFELNGGKIIDDVKKLTEILDKITFYK